MEPRRGPAVEYVPERECAEPVRDPLARVIAEMDAHLAGVEGAEDSPVARWARELREAVDGR